MLEQLDEQTYGETGIAIGPAFTCKGYGKQILNTLVDYARDILGAKKFFASCRSANKVSKGLILSRGFSYSTRKRKWMREVVKGIRWSVIIMSYKFENFGLAETRFGL